MSKPEEQLSERAFIDGLLEGVNRDYKHPKRREEFAMRWWAVLVAQRPDAPDIADRQTWTPGTLKRWKEPFAKIAQEGKAKVKRNNLRIKSPPDNPNELVEFNGNMIPKCDRDTYLRLLREKSAKQSDFILGPPREGWIDFRNWPF
jgi:hypothetical protein